MYMYVYIYIYIYILFHLKIENLELFVNYYSKLFFFFQVCENLYDM